MKKNIILIFCFLLAGNIFFAFDLKGHQVIAKIAELNVKPQTLAKINKILQNGETMISVAGWPDDIREERKETDHWHTVPISIEFNATLKNIKIFYPRTPDSVIFQVKKEIKELKDPKTPANKKYEDLKFLIHFVGDIHMPMHCATNGGKNIIVPENNGKAIPLHAVWDTILPVKDVDEYAEQLNAGITDEQKKSWAASSPDEWVYESFIISKEIIFKDHPLKANTIKISKDYKKEMAPIGKERVQKAGIRLAMLLDEIFK